MKKQILNVAIIGALALSFQSCSNSEPGTLSGLYSVSESQQVKFSSGNLQYDVTAKVWKFADNQWNVLGSKNNELDNNREGFTGVIDLFSIGSADNATLDESEAEHQFNEWGKNPIANASNKPNEWRTLSAKEMEYVFMKRPNAMQLIYPATIDTIKGIVLLPDNYTINKSKVFIMKESDYKGWSSIDLINSDSLFVANKYTYDEFKTLEQEVGAVFFPFGGQKFTRIKDNVDGGYWTTGNDRGASYCSLTNRSVWPDRGCSSDCFRFSVRLVKDVVSK
ncbi:MAG: hypothetical protein MJ211_13070 [Bacteroidales bacterium]|nr:hypothetical protein [Bacteroidales bacterium]